MEKTLVEQLKEYGLDKGSIFSKSIPESVVWMIYMPLSERMAYAERWDKAKC